MFEAHLGSQLIIRTSRSLSLTEAGRDCSGITIKSGEKGTVDRYDRSTGYTFIKLDRHHEGLAAFDNCIWIIPPDVEVPA